MSKGNTWQKQKIAKHRANNMRSSHGGYARHAPTPNKAIGEDRRDGGMKPVHYPTPEVTIGPLPAAREGLHIATILPGNARGLSKDIGRIGKGGRTFKKATKLERQHYSQRNLNGIIRGCFATSTKWELYRGA